MSVKFSASWFTEGRASPWFVCRSKIGRTSPFLNRFFIHHGRRECVLIPDSTRALPVVFIAREKKIDEQRPSFFRVWHAVSPHIDRSQPSIGTRMSIILCSSRTTEEFVPPPSDSTSTTRVHTSPSFIAFYSWFIAILINLTRSYYEFLLIYVEKGVFHRSHWPWSFEWCSNSCHGWDLALFLKNKSNKGIWILLVLWNWRDANLKNWNIES